MALVISHEPFWAVVALFFFWIILSWSWTGYTVFTVPKWQVAWAKALIGILIVNHLNSFYGFAFALIVRWVNWPWSLALKTETFTSSSGFIVSVVSRTWLTLRIYWIKKHWGRTSDAVVPNFDESSGATWLDLELIPAGVSSWESSWTLLSKSKCDKRKEHNCFEVGACHE